MEEKLTEQIRIKLENLMKDNPKLEKALKKIQDGEELTPKLQKFLEETATEVFEAPIIAEQNMEAVDEIKKFGLEEGASEPSIEELKAQIENLQNNLSAARESLEMIASFKPSAKDCARIAERGLEQSTLRKWKNSKKASKK